MVGNAAEWVADWAPLVDCSPTPSVDYSACLAAVVRGGNFLDGERAGVFSVRNDSEPGSGDVGIGFRCAR